MGKKQAAMSKLGFFLSIAHLCSLMSLCIAKPKHFLIETDNAAEEHGSGEDYQILHPRPSTNPPIINGGGEDVLEDFDHILNPRPSANQPIINGGGEDVLEDFDLILNPRPSANQP